VIVGFVDISLVEAPVVKRGGGCGAYRKGRNGRKWDETVFWGDTKNSGGVWHIRLEKEGAGLNEEDNWIRLK